MMLRSKHASTVLIGAKNQSKALNFVDRGAAY